MIWQNSKLSRFTNTKDVTPKEFCSSVVYKFTCPGCHASYIGKTDRNLSTRILEHTKPHTNSELFNHINSCHNFQHIHNVLNLPDLLSNHNLISLHDIVGTHHSCQTLTANKTPESKQINTHDKNDVISRTKPTFNSVISIVQTRN